MWRLFFNLVIFAVFINENLLHYKLILEKDFLTLVVIQSPSETSKVPSAYQFQESSWPVYLPWEL